MNKADQIVERIAVVDLIKEFFVNSVKNSSFPVLLIDSDNEVDLEKLKEEIGDGVEYFDMTVFISSPYRTFEQGVILPFVNGDIKVLLLDNVDSLPDDPQFDDHRSILRSMMKSDLCYIYPDKMNADEQGHIGMRCSVLPDFTPSNCPALIDCKSEIWDEEFKERQAKL